MSRQVFTTHVAVSFFFFFFFVVVVFFLFCFCRVCFLFFSIGSRRTLVRQTECGLALYKMKWLYGYLSVHSTHRLCTITKKIFFNYRSCIHTLRQDLEIKKNTGGRETWSLLIMYFRCVMCV